MKDAKKTEALTAKTVATAITFGDRTAELGNNLFGLLSIDPGKSYYATAQTIVQTANGIGMVADINRIQCCLFADAIKNPDVSKDYKTIEEFIKALEIPQFFKTDANGEVKFNKTVVSQMCAAGIVYNDDKAPESLKSRPWSVLGAMGKIIRNADEREILYTSVSNGELEIKTQQDAKEYAKFRADAHKKTKSGDTKGGEDKNHKGGEDKNPKGGEDKPIMYLLEICSDGVFHASYDADKSGVVTFGKTLEEVKTTLDSMISCMVSDATVCASSEPLPDGRVYGAIVSTTGDATVYRLTKTEQKSVTMPPAAQIAGLRKAREVMESIGRKMDEQDELLLEVADMLGW